MEEILRLSKVWYEYVSMDHHKDRDCHFKIVKDFRYGDEVVYWVEHEGYIAGDIFSDDFKTYEKAETELIKTLKNIISKEQKWARRVLDNKADYDDWNVKQAEYISKIEL